MWGFPGGEVRGRGIAMRLVGATPAVVMGTLYRDFNHLVLACVEESRVERCMAVGEWRPVDLALDKAAFASDNAAC
jgi:hypothetical protein